MYIFFVCTFEKTNLSEGMNRCFYMVNTCWHLDFNTQDRWEGKSGIPHHFTQCCISFWQMIYQPLYFSYAYHKQNIMLVTFVVLNGKFFTMIYRWYNILFHKIIIKSTVEYNEREFQLMTRKSLDMKIYPEHSTFHQYAVKRGGVIEINVIFFFNTFVAKFMY